MPAVLAGANVDEPFVFPLGSLVSARFVQLALDHPSKNAELVELAREVARKTLNLGLIKEVLVPSRPSMNSTRSSAASTSCSTSRIQSRGDSLQPKLGLRRSRKPSCRRHSPASLFLRRRSWPVRRVDATRLQTSC